MYNEYDEDNLWLDTELIPADDDEPKELWQLIQHGDEVIRPDW